MQEYITTIQVIGLPAVAFLLMYRLVEGTLKELRQEMKDSRTCLAENTKVIALLCQEFQEHVRQKEQLIEMLKDHKRATP